MNTINITISNSTVTINNYPVPYKQVKDTQGMLHTFYTKEEYKEFISELQEQR